MSGWNYEVKQSGGLFLKLNPGGVAKIRIVGEPFPFLSVLQSGEAERFGLLVLVKPVPPETEATHATAVQVWTTSGTVFTALKTYVENPAWGDPTQYDLYIKRNGSGLDTKYEIIPDPTKSPITAAESKLLADANVDLRAVCLKNGKPLPDSGYVAPAGQATQPFNPFATAGGQQQNAIWQE